VCSNFINISINVRKDKSHTLNNISDKTQASESQNQTDSITVSISKLKSEKNPERFDDTKRVTKSHKTDKTMVKIKKMTNNDLQNTTQKTKD